MNLILLNYNNYFNRIVKKGLLQDYMSCERKKVVQIQGFNQNDGVTTTREITTDMNFTPDYCVVCDNSNHILHRWFVTDCTRISMTTYRISLKRDVLVDYYDEVVNGTCFIEKGYVNNDNPLIYNKEDFTCNQIKKGEILLRDKSYMSWIALYYNLSKKSDLTGTVATIEQPYINLGTTLESWDLYSRYNSQYKRTIRKQLGISVDAKFTLTEPQVWFDDNMNYQHTYKENNDTELEVDAGYDDAIQLVIDAVNDNKTSLISALNSYDEEQDTFETLMSYSDRIVKTSNNKFYKISIVKDDVDWDSLHLQSGTLYNALVSTFKPAGVWKDKFSGGFDDAFLVLRQYQNYHIVAEEIINEVTTYTYDFRNCVDILDAPYGLLLLPYKSMDKRGRPVTIGTSSYINEELSMLIAKDLTKSGVGSSSIIYDAQIVPYCPVNLQSFVGVNTIELYVGNLDEDQFTFIYDSNSNKVSFAIHPNYCKFTKDIDVRTQMAVDFHYYNEDKKVNNQCTFIRLTSPNYSGSFEFNPARNNGVNYINVDCTYKPFMPYIHLNPDFKELYGQDFNDAFGLICGGDFSLSVVSSAWETYKLQNKNFEKIFDRQIQNADVMHNIDRTNAIVNATIGSIGSVNSALNKDKAKDVSSGLRGVGLGLIQDAVEIGINETKYQLSKDYTIDQHNYQLDNVKALPNTLNKVDAYNNNNKIFPFLELYSCTDEEKQIFAKKLEFEGMTINAVGKIDTYIKNGDYNTFIKGQMMRITDINDDSHILYTIYDEILKGAYFNGKLSN